MPAKALRHRLVEARPRPHPAAASREAGKMAQPQNQSINHYSLLAIPSNYFSLNIGKVLYDIANFY